jgi:hypothetical protein
MWKKPSNGLENNSFEVVFNSIATNLQFKNGNMFYKTKTRIQYESGFLASKYYLFLTENPL